MNPDIITKVDSTDTGSGVAPVITESMPRHENGVRPLPDDVLIILPVRNVVMFPGVVAPLTVGRERSRAAVQEAARLERPIGGVKEKVLAALRAGITTVLLPERNRRDLDDVPAEARDRLKFVWVERVDQALQEALAGALTSAVV